MASFRRSNKSHKVPNVKLRPVLPSSSTRSHRTASHDSGFESDHETTFMDTCPRPLRSVVLCATGINDKTAIFKQAIELGAQPLNDLTDKVTHLLALEPGSAKYKCAVQCKLPIMHPSWITECYNVWLKGDDVDFAESVRTHRLPPFTGVVLCISGIEDEAQRVKINRLVTSGGGQYVKDITRPVRVTHLLCSTGIEEGSEKVKYAQRFNEKGEAHIRLVWEEWFWDSIEAHGCCDEEQYNIAKPRPARKPTQELEQPAAPVAPTQSGESAKPRPKAPIDTADLLNGEEEEHVLAARLPAVTAHAWEGMLRSRGFQRRGNNFYSSQAAIPSHSKSQPNQVRDAGDIDKSGMRTLARHVTEGQKSSVIASFRRADSFAPLTKDTSAQRHQRPFARATTMPDADSFAAPETGPIIAEGGVVAPVVDDSSELEPNPPKADAPNVKSGPFTGLIFRPMGEARSAGLRAAVENAGGRVVSEDSDEDVNYVVVRLVSGSRLYREEADEEERAKFRTECWLERCLNEVRVCAPEEHVLFVPLKVETPIPGAEQVVLSHTGLDEEEVCWMIKRLARALGFTIPNAFSRHSTHLLCSSRSGVKYEKALQWGIPIVDMAWLTDVAISGVIASSSGSKAAPAAESKGKGREKTDDPADKEKENAMFDITNTPPLLLKSPEDDVQDPHDDGDDRLLPNGLLGLAASAALTQPTIDDDPAPAAHTPAKSHATQLSLAEIREDMKRTRIPSSETPSPEKPFIAASDSEPNSPVRLDKKAAVGLSVSINSLLKRPAKEVAPEPEKRRKRARPASRSKTDSDVVKPQAKRSSPPTAGGSRVFDPFHDDAPGSTAARAANVRDESMRVTYEDPAQLVEKQRLMQLLKEQGGDGDAWDPEASASETQSSSSRGKRKSQRKAPTRRSARVLHMGS